MLSRRVPGALAAILVAGSCAVTPAPTASPMPSSAGTPTPGIVACPAAPLPAPDPAPWWADRAFYEMFVRSFADSDGDGVGDFRGATARLDYLNDGDAATTDDLGLTGIWLMPVAEAASYHGYDVLDYTAIERDYGTADDFLAFVTAAHERGIRVIVDLVVNHTARDHPWFLDARTPGSAHDDWYVWSDVDPGWPAAAGPDPWHPAGERYYYGVFWEGMPDLNLRNPAVTAELQRVASIWLHDYGVDGFRLDAAKHLIENGPEAQVNTPETHAWLAGFRSTAHQVRPDGLVLGEVWEPRVTTSGYVADGSLDMAFDFGAGPTIASAVTLGDVTSLEVMQAEVAGRYPVGSAATFLSNHDQERVMTTLRGDVAAARAAATALLTGPGVPFLYYGEEIGLVGAKPDERIRTPLPWTAEDGGHGFTTGTPWQPFGDGAATANVELESADAGSLLSHYRRLIRFRTEHPVLAVGAVTRVDASGSLVSAVLRHDADETLLVLQNLGTEAARGVALTLDAGPLCGSPSAAILFSTDVAVSGPAAIPAITAAGGLDGFVPLADLPPRATVVLDLSP